MSDLKDYFFTETHSIRDRTCYIWKINEYHASSLKNKRDMGMRSDFFVFENKRFCLEAQFKYTGKRYKDGKEVKGDTLCIKVIPESTLLEVDVMFYISLKNKDYINAITQDCFIKRGRELDELRVISETELLTRSTELIINDCLILSCEIAVVQTSHESYINPILGTVSCCSRLDALSRDLGRLFSSKDGADFVLRVEGQCIPVHSQILSVRSSFFADMFQNQNDIKNISRVADIADIGISEFNCLLKYIYTGEVRELKELSSDSLVQLYTAAEKYDLKELKDMCSLVMQTKLSEDNLEKYATLALTRNDQKLMKAVAALLKLNKDLMYSEFGIKLANRFPNFPVQILNLGNECNKRRKDHSA